MEVVNWVLIHGAGALLWLWHAAASVLGDAAAVADRILNPVLSPLLAFLNPVTTTLGDAVYAALRPLPVWLGLTILSAVVGVVMLLAFRATSNQTAIAKTKDTIKANLLALKLYKDELRVTFLAQWRLLRAIVRLQRYMLTPVFFLALPMLLGLAQMGVRYQWRPLQPGETTILKMRLDDSRVDAAKVFLEPSRGLRVVAGPVPGGGEVVWRIRAGEAGEYLLRFDVDGKVVEKEMVVGGGLQRVSAERSGPRWTSQLFHPVERRLPADSPVSSIEILYPGRDSWFYGADYWVISFFVISMAVALIFAPVFKVRF